MYDPVVHLNSDPDQADFLMRYKSDPDKTFKKL